MIEKIAPDRSQVTIHHDTIPGYMIEMTMDFPVDDADELKDLVPGDKITFTLNVDQDRDWVSNIHRVGHTDPTMTSMCPWTTAKLLKLKPGDMLPDGELISRRWTAHPSLRFSRQSGRADFLFHPLSAAHLLPVDESKFLREPEIFF